jgi:hypothetical protein
MPAQAGTMQLLNVKGADICGLDTEQMQPTHRQASIQVPWSWMALDWMQHPLFRLIRQFVDFSGCSQGIS